jgi:integrase
MFKVLKKSRGTEGESANYYLRYKLGSMPREKWKCLGVSTLEAANAKANEFRREFEWERQGITPSKALKDGHAKALADHLEDYLRDKAAKRQDGKYISNCRAHILRVVQDCGWKFVDDVEAGDFMDWRADQAHLHGKTLNDYLADLKTFFAWLKRLGRALLNPFDNVERVDARREDGGRPRALFDDELNALCASTQGERRCLYRFAARSGLRRDELEKLVWGDLLLDADTPQVEVRASTAKNAKREFVDLLDGSADMMREYRPHGARSTDPVFPSGVPHIRIVKADFVSAGIPLVDERRRRVVFHSLRHTFGTWLACNEYPLQVTQRLMRHSDPKITAGIYTDAKVLMAEYRKRRAANGEQQERLRGRLQIPGQASQPVAEAGETAPNGKPTDVAGPALLGHILAVLGELWRALSDGSSGRIRRVFPCVLLHFSGSPAATQA